MSQDTDQPLRADLCLANRIGLQADPCQSFK